MNYTTSDIAELLDLTQYTVKKHIKKLSISRGTCGSRTNIFQSGSFTFC